MEDLQETNPTPIGLEVQVTPLTCPVEVVEAVEAVEEVEVEVEVEAMETPMTKTMDPS